MKSRRIFILLGHPDEDSFNCTLANEYQRGAEVVGHEVRRVNISDMEFDPVLHHGYRLIQELEPDLKAFQENMRWCEHFVVFYPSWWSTMPALLKGLFDRTWIPGFAFGDTTNELKKGILWFAGFGPIYVRKLGYLKHFGGTGRRERLKRKVYNLGRKAK